MSLSSANKLRPSISIPTVLPRASAVYSLRTSNSTAASSTVSLSSLFATSSIALPKDAIDDIKSIIHHAFVPHIAVHASEDTMEIVKEKGFTDLVQLLQPYGEKMEGRITVRDSHGASVPFDDFGVRFVNITSLSEEAQNPTNYTPTETNGIRTSLEARRAVGGDINAVDDLLALHIDHADELIDTSLTFDKETQTGEAFYHLYLRRLLSGLPLSAHETFSHPVACLIAISSRNSAPIETLRKLYKSGNELISPHYVNKEYLRYYVLVHDEDRDDITKSTALFEQMKRHFGLHCHLIRLRSAMCITSDDDATAVPISQWLTAAEELSEIHKQDQEFEDNSSRRYLTGSDETAIRTMIREMVAQSVIPFMERNIATWNDQVLSRRKGLSGRVMSFSKRFLGSSGRAAAATSSTSNYNALTGSYDASTPEGQMRKLADYAFMLRDWKLAHNVYDTLRSDFNNDKAWMYLAGAQEMTIISLLLTTQPITSKIRSDTIDVYLDSACYSYITRCSSLYSAMRCLLVAVELLRVSGGSSAELAAKWAIKALELKPKYDIGKALITQRVGDCYTVKRGAGSGGWGGRRRKAALWHLLAAETWVILQKFAQARYCIDLAIPAYKDVNFTSITQFIESLKKDCGYHSLLNFDDDSVPFDGAEKMADGEKDLLEDESETLNMSQRKSLLIAGLDGLDVNSEDNEEGSWAENTNFVVGD